MSSLAERLRVRSDKKPMYNYDESDDDLVVPKGKREGKADEKPKRFVRADAKEDACQTCAEGGSLMSCATCTYSYHLKCLLPPSRATPGHSWSCPECVSPLNETDKILDCEMRPAKPGTQPKFDKQYLVKWKGLSYLHCTWVSEKDFVKASQSIRRLKIRLNYFYKQMDSMNNPEDETVAIRPEWTTVDRILASRKITDEREYLVKWKELPYDECHWELESNISAFQSEIERFKIIKSRGRRKSSGKTKLTNGDSKELRHRHFEHNPEFLSGGSLHPYQLEGLNFLRYAWAKNTHVILADEMGLGKTIQSIAFLASLFQENLYPHLVVAPLSTLRNWEREFATWAPEMNVVMYFGSAAARAVIREHEFYYPKPKVAKPQKKGTIKDLFKKKQSRIKFDVLLTSYEMITMDSVSLKPIRWECMIVDEGHRLKNKDSKLFLQLKLYSTKHRVLLTGTPLQNNLDELFMLMHFLDDGKFASIEDFQKEFADINQEEQVVRLHKMLAPHLLRRVKKDVMKELPPKKELILRVELSNKQKEYYKAILTRNYQILARRGVAQISLLNVVMELRKLCCHAYMLEGVEPVVEPTDAGEGLRQLLDASGKMHLLDKMMVKLKEQGHRVLIYSQFQHMLDLLEDYLSYKKWSYERIDGRIGGAERQIRIDRFNAKNSTRFCFLLSTRAGGLGINLATADTVIIYDSDWNPHADLQAMARAHRLGQINKVMIYRLITRSTIEERMMQLTKKKMILEHLVVGRLKAQTVNQEELDDIIRYGSKELFADEGDEAGKARQIHYDDSAIDRLLNRDQIGEDSSVVDEDDSFLKAFKVANFEYIDEVEAEAAKVEEARKQSMLDNASSRNNDKANYWDELLKDRYESHKVEEFTSMGKGKRSRKQMAASAEDDIPGVQDVSSEDEDYQYEDDSSDHEANSPGIVLGRKGQPPRKRSRDFTEKLPLMEGEGKSFRVVGFNQNQRNMFLQILMRFGFGKFDWKEFIPRLKVKTPEEIHAYGALFMRHVTEEATESQNFSDGVPKEGPRVEEVLIRVANIQLIEEKVEFASKNSGVALFFEDLIACFPGLRGKNWKDEHDLLLLKAIIKHGYARWQTMIEDKDLGLADVVQQVLNLPPVNGHVTGDVPMPDGSSSNHTANGGTEADKGSQPNTDYPAQYQIRELHRRVVDFIKRRYLLLEKALNAEYCLAQIGYTRPPESGKQDQEAEHNDTKMPLSISLMKGFPLLELITAEEVVYDNKSGCLEMARLYNRMLRVLDDNAIDAVKAHMGDPSAGFCLCNSMCQIETIYDGLQRILTGPEMSSAAAAQAKVEKPDSTLPRGDMKAEVMRESRPGVEATREDGVGENRLQPGVAKAENPTAMHCKLNGSSEEGKDVKMAEAYSF